MNLRKNIEFQNYYYISQNQFKIILALLSIELSVKYVNEHRGIISFHYLWIQYCKKEQLEIVPQSLIKCGVSFKIHWQKITTYNDVILFNYWYFIYYANLLQLTLSEM